MNSAKLGDLVSVIYDGFIGDELFETSKETGPLEFTLGAGQVMTGFEENIIGMTAGEHKTFVLSAEQAHGAHNPELVHNIPRHGLKEPENIQPGVVLGLNMEKDGQTHQVPAMVTEVREDEITVDFNHPLAGTSLTYKVTLESISQKKTA